MNPTTYYTTRPIAPRLKLPDSIPTKTPDVGPMSEQEIAEAMGAQCKAEGREPKMPTINCEVSKRHERTELIRRAVEKLGQPSRQEIQDEIGASKSSIHTWVPDAIKDGVIVALGGCNNRTYALATSSAGQTPAQEYLTPEQQDEAVLQRVANLERNLSKATMSAIGRPFANDCGNFAFSISEVVGRLEVAGLVESTSYRFQDLTTAKLTPAGWDVVGDKPIWIT